MGGTSGRTDIFWYGPGSGSDHIWLATGNNGFKSYSTTVKGTYVPFKGDFDGDGFGDIFWYAAGSASDWIWFGRPTGYSFDGEGTAVSGTYIPVP